MSSNPVSIFDVVPQGDSGEALQNSEPSIAVNPVNPLQMMAGSFGFYTFFFASTDGGSTWSDLAALSTSDKSLAWSADGSTALAATFATPNDTTSAVYTYAASAIVPNGGFGAPINQFTGSGQNDQPWIRTGPNGHTYVAYNNLGNFDTTNMTASVNVSMDGGALYPLVLTIEQVAATAGQDDPAIRLGVNGNTVYAIFDRWNTTVESDPFGQRYESQFMVVKSVLGGADLFSALDGLGGVEAAAHLGAISEDVYNTPLTFGLERIAGGDIAIAVDPNNANHVVLAYTNAPGFDGAGVVQLVVTESTDGGNTWTEKYATPYTVRSGQPALAILTDGTIGFLYNDYDPITNTLSQQLVTTNNDFASVNTFVLATETNNSYLTFRFNPYLGDFFDLTSLGDTFYGSG